MHRFTSYLFVILSILLQNIGDHFHLFCFVFVALNLVYFDNLNINKVGILNGTRVLLHLNHL